MSDPPLPSPGTQSKIKIDSAMRQFSFVNWKIDTMTAEIRTLERRMTDLRLEIHEKELALRTTWSDRLEHTAKQYSQAHLRDWSSVLYVLLPRELRDIIYSLCLHHDFDGQVLARSLSILYGFSDQNDDWRKEQRLREYVLLDPAFVGREVAKEIAEMVYRGADVPFFGMSGHDGKPRILHLRAFLKSDFFGSGLRAGDHIRRLQLELHKNKLNKYRSSLYYNLRSLFLYCNNRSLKVEMRFPRGNSAVDVLVYLRVLRKIHASFTSANISFDVSYIRRVHDPRCSGVDKDEVTDLNLTHMFEISQGIWKEHLMTLCECVGELWVREKRWLGYRARKKQRDVWDEMGEETLRLVDTHGRNVWDGLPGGCTPLWGECWNEEHWHQGTCHGVHEEDTE
ncbi:hypothetical protein SLS60_004762 [Paraconiothyrium brasiliense]|uniref:Uncharacterized protein n=1 Tax=Paraconiothyrium brasiliense TaxID=300254 RepID=A0ABR3RM00_9PLEO